MSVASICTRPVVIVHRARQAGTGAYGDDALVEVDRVPTRAHLHQRTSDEPTPAASEAIASRWAATLPVGVALGADDLVEVDGQLYEIEGDPFPAWWPTGQRTHHVEVGLVQMVGSS